MPNFYWHTNISECLVFDSTSYVDISRENNRFTVEVNFLNMEYGYHLKTNRSLNEVTLKTKAPNVKELVLRGNLLKEINLSTVRLVRLDLSENQLYAFTIDERKLVLPKKVEI